MPDTPTARRHGWTDAEVALAREVWSEVFPRAEPSKFDEAVYDDVMALECGTLPATTAIPLKAARLALRKVTLADPGEKATARLHADVAAAQGEAPAGRYARGSRSPIVWVRLCAACAGFGPFTPEDYDGALSGGCAGCGVRTRETHRFCAVIDSASGCSCGTHGKPVIGDLHASGIGPGEDVRALPPDACPDCEGRRLLPYGGFEWGEPCQTCRGTGVRVLGGE